MKGERMIRRVYAEPVSEWWGRMRVFLDTTMDSINGGNMRPRTWDTAAKMRGDDLRDAEFWELCRITARVEYDDDGIVTLRWWGDRNVGCPSEESYLAKGEHVFATPWIDPCNVELLLRSRVMSETRKAVIAYARSLRDTRMAYLIGNMQLNLDGLR